MWTAYTVEQSLLKYLHVDSNLDIIRNSMQNLVITSNPFTPKSAKFKTE